MNNPLPCSTLIPAWQIERAGILQRICRAIQIDEDAGKTLKKFIRVASWRWNGKPLRKHPARRLQLGRITIYRLYRHWQRNGQVPSAFYQKYAAKRRRIPAAPLVRFIQFCVDRDFNSLREACLAFNKLGGNRGPGMVHRKRLSVKYDALRWHLPHGFFSTVKLQKRVIQKAQRELGRIKLEAIAQIIARVPARIEKHPDFEI